MSGLADDLFVKTSQSFHLYFGLVFLLFTLASCYPKRTSPPRGPQTSPYCAGPISYPAGTAVQISGEALFEYRDNRNGGAIAGPLPIRHSEVVIKNFSGQTIQCGHTDASGKFSLTVPASEDPHWLYVSSRVNNSHLKAYVLDHPENLEPYSLKATITPFHSFEMENPLIAPATDTLEGGAFYILDQLLEANTFLESSTHNCDATFPGCRPFVAASQPLLKVFWRPGFNPGCYFSQDMCKGGVSFYIPGYQEMYLLGGNNNSVDTDTDHFDSTIILHEYAHYLEDTLAKSDSPGGSHNGDSMIDPRLAWSEGFANFFQAAVTGYPYYLDTGGVANFMTYLKLPLDLSLVGQPGCVLPGCYKNDVPKEEGEGTFREFAVARFLWSLLDEDPGNFAEIWAVLTKKEGGLADSRFDFRAMELFHELQRGLAGSSDWSLFREAEKQAGFRKHYAAPLVAGSCSLEMEDLDENDNGSLHHSNLLTSNAFYMLEHPGGSLYLDLSYLHGIIPIDLDLYLYEPGYRYLNSPPGVSANFIVNSDEGDPLTETIFVQSLAKGNYLVNVRLYNGPQSGNKAAVPTFYERPALIPDAREYTLEVGGQKVCPAEDPNS